MSDGFALVFPHCICHTVFFFLQLSSRELPLISKQSPFPWLYVVCSGVPARSCFRT